MRCVRRLKITSPNYTIPFKKHCRPYNSTFDNPYPSATNTEASPGGTSTSVGLNGLRTVTVSVVLRSGIHHFNRVMETECEIRQLVHGQHVLALAKNVGMLGIIHFCTQCRKLMENHLLWYHTYAHSDSKRVRESTWECWYEIAGVWASERQIETHQCVLFFDHTSVMSFVQIYFPSSVVLCTFAALFPWYKNSVPSSSSAILIPCGTPNSCMVTIHGSTACVQPVRTAPILLDRVNLSGTQLLQLAVNR